MKKSKHGYTTPAALDDVQRRLLELYSFLPIEYRSEAVADLKFLCSDTYKATRGFILHDIAWSSREARIVRIRNNSGRRAFWNAVLSVGYRNLPPMDVFKKHIGL